MPANQAFKVCSRPRPSPSRRIGGAQKRMDGPRRPWHWSLHPVRPDLTREFRRLQQVPLPIAGKVMAVSGMRQVCSEDMPLAGLDHRKRTHLIL